MEPVYFVSHIAGKFFPIEPFEKHLYEITWNHLQTIFAGTAVIILFFPHEANRYSFSKVFFFLPINVLTISTQSFEAHYGFE